MKKQREKPRKWVSIIMFSYAHALWRGAFLYDDGGSKFPTLTP